MARSGRTRSVTASQARRYLAKAEEYVEAHPANSTLNGASLRRVWPSMPRSTLPMPCAVSASGSEPSARITMRCSYC